MKTLKRNGNTILLCIFEILIGVLLLIDPVTFSSGIIIICGVLLLIGGIVSCIHYFRLDIPTAIVSQSLFKGLVLLAAGLFCIFRFRWFVATFPLLTMIYGVVVLLAGFGKIQWAVNMLRIRKSRWFLAAVSAAVSIICALVILSSPFASTAVLWMFTGISLIVEAVFDIVALLAGGESRNAQKWKELD